MYHSLSKGRINNMAKLSEIHRLIGNYIELHGDKDVTSIGSGHGTEYEYFFNLHDIYNGSVGLNPYAGADKLYIFREKLC